VRDFSLGRAGLLLSGGVTGLVACFVTLRYLAPEMYFDIVRFVNSIIDGFRDGIARMVG
jgi:hypothetical protein